MIPKKPFERREIPIDQIMVGEDQMRKRNVDAGIDELANSIRAQGVLEPIIVRPVDQATKGSKARFELISGQRRLLACQQLEMKEIPATIMHIAPDAGHVISLTENLMRRDPTMPDYVDACTALFRRYGSLSVVAKETGLPMSKVAQYVKYDRLNTELKKLVDQGKVDLSTALNAQDASLGDDKDAIRLASEMASMTAIQQNKVVRARKAARPLPIDEAIRRGIETQQVVIQLSASVYGKLQDFAAEHSTTPGPGAAQILADFLSAWEPQHVRTEKETQAKGQRKGRKRAA